jgi:hypothetical protein
MLFTADCQVKGSAPHIQKISSCGNEKGPLLRPYKVRNPMGAIIETIPL